MTVVKVPKPDPPPVKLFTADELTRLFKACDAEKDFLLLLRCRARLFARRDRSEVIGAS